MTLFDRHDHPAKPQAPGPVLQSSRPPAMATAADQPDLWTPPTDDRRREDLDGYEPPIP